MILQATNDLDNLEAAWRIDPAVLQRLWPVIDVYGRIGRALRAVDGARGRSDMAHAGDGSAA